jgi:hypothetical protein
MYSFPDDVSATLQQQPVKSSQSGALTIVSTESLSAETMKQARPLAAH